MTTTAIQTTSGNNTPTPASTPSAPGSPLANQSVFLQLLIAQLKHQDPEDPADGTQFVTQLAQFTTLEQTTQSRLDLDQMLKIMQAAASSQTSSNQPSTKKSS